MLNKEFIALMRCPENRSSLALADAGLVAEVNTAISAGRLKNRAGMVLADRLAGGLIRQVSRGALSHQSRRDPHLVARRRHSLEPTVIGGR